MKRGEEEKRRMGRVTEGEGGRRRGERKKQRRKGEEIKREKIEANSRGDGEKIEK